MPKTPRGVADHPLVDQLKTMWQSGMRTNEINAWLVNNGSSPITPATLSRYGQRYWKSVPPSGRTHLVIPDTQIKPGVPTIQLEWIGKYIIERKPDVIVHLGDHWDLPSLSSYDRGTKSMEGRRYREDVDAGNTAFALLDAPTTEHNATALIPYLPDKHLLRGNHEDRISRAVESNAQMEGTIGYEDLLSPGWEIHNFLEPVVIDGISYCHYYYNPMTGRPYGGACATRLKTIGYSFTMGHQQTLDFAMRPVGRGLHYGLVAGACYLHEENYKGPQGNTHWRGVIVKHEVENGEYDPMFVSLDYLCRRYEGVSLKEYTSS